MFWLGEYPTSAPPGLHTASVFCEEKHRRVQLWRRRPAPVQNRLCWERKWNKKRKQLKLKQSSTKLFHPIIKNIYFCHFDLLR